MYCTFSATSAQKRRTQNYFIGKTLKQDELNIWLVLAFSWTNMCCLGSPFQPCCCKSKVDQLLQQQQLVFPETHSQSRYLKDLNTGSGLARFWPKRKWLWRHTNSKKLYACTFYASCDGHIMSSRTGRNRAMHNPRWRSPGALIWTIILEVWCERENGCIRIE